MSTKLNQLIAIEKGAKSQANAEVTAAYQRVGKADLLAGISRTYRPLDDMGEELPSESKRVQVRTREVIAEVKSTLTRLFDVTATKDTANCAAKADVTVDGITVARDLPVTYLLFLEKQLGELKKFVAKLPTLDPAESWSFDEVSDCYATQPSQTVRTKKVPRNHVLAPATDKHPAQVEVYHEDVVVGRWTTTKFSGALPAKEVGDIDDRLGKLLDAVRVARETANATPVTDVEPGRAVLDYLFG
ncbi:DUF7873 family protein [Nocardia grenadensis]|uniref:DUF7873 family protein n=1 Tax=Nocardia grenadensis TaxID=931537 RepID=UPI0007A4D867|nr:hypothetical protein [Nocardia grenadensis]